MNTYNPKKNNEGYIDMTAYEAIENEISAGEVYTYHDKEVLIVANQGNFCNILTLCEEKNTDDCIEIQINTNEVRYTHPAMMAYAFNNKLWIVNGKISDREFAKVLDAVKKAMGFATENKDEPSFVMEQDKIVIKADKSKELQAKIDLLQTMYNDLLNRVFDRMKVDE